MQKSDLPYRQVHLDFHTSPEIGGLAADFDPDEFASAFARAQVASVTCFARCHHGYLYYDSPRFPELVHPGLTRRNLLGEQLAALRGRGIRAPVYLPVQHDGRAAREHPEWLALDREGSPYGLYRRPDGTWLGAGPYEAGFYRRLCLNSAYADFVKAQIDELFGLFEIDGLFLDIVYKTDCSCERCKSLMLGRGLDPSDDGQRDAFAAETLAGFQRSMTSFIRERSPSCSIYYNNGSIEPGFHPALDAYTHLEFDCLPGSGPAGYASARANALFARTLGLECVSQTGRFHTDWGDLRSYRGEDALSYECFQALALCSRCLVGDQLDPSGRLDPAAYELIGKVFSSVKEKEPWCAGARPVVEAGVLAPAKGASASGSLRGAMTLLQERACQADVLDAESDFSRYALLVLPDRVRLDEALRRRIEDFAAKGGALLASFESGLRVGADEFASPILGARVAGPGPRDDAGEPARGRVYDRSDFADYIVPRPALRCGLPETEHVMYQGAMRVAAEDGAEILAELVEPLFYRSWRRFSSHRQAPPAAGPAGPAALRAGRAIYFAHPVFDIYSNFAPPWCKSLVSAALELLIPDPLVRHGGPSTMEAYLDRQDAERRLVLHLLNYVPIRKAERLVSVERGAPLYGVPVSVRADGAVRRVALAPEGRGLEFRQAGGRVEFAVPVVDGHRMVELAY
jgi:hypothetical protein